MKVEQARGKWKVIKSKSRSKWDKFPEDEIQELENKMKKLSPKFLKNNRFKKEY